MKDEKKDPECKNPVYSFDEQQNQLRISLAECEREARFYLRILRAKVIIEQFRVPLMLNLSSHDPLNDKVIQANDDIPIYAKFLRYPLFLLILIFVAYFLLSDIKFLNNCPLKMIGNFLKMIDFIQCLALLEVKYRVLTTKFFWLIQLIFSSPEFGLLEGYLNEQQDLRREKSLGKVYEEYGDRMAFSNYDLVISVYFGTIIVDILVGLLPCKLERVRNVVGGFRELMYNYSFFEFFINIQMDLSNTKKIISKGNWLAKIFLNFEFLILSAELLRISLKLIFGQEEEEGDSEYQSDQNGLKKTDKLMGNEKITKRAESLLGLPESERNPLKSKNNNKIEKEQKRGGRNRIKRSKGRSFSLGPHKYLNKKENRSKNRSGTQKLENQSPQNEDKRKGRSMNKQNTNKGKIVRKKSLFKKIFAEFDLISDMRFIIVQTLIFSLREPSLLQFGIIWGIQLVITSLALIRLLFYKTEQKKLVQFCEAFQELSIAAFILLIVILKISSDKVQYLLLISLSVAIIAEFLLILIEVVKDVIIGVVIWRQKRIKKGLQKQKIHQEGELAPSRVKEGCQPKRSEVFNERGFRLPKRSSPQDRWNINCGKNSKNKKVARKQVKAKKKKDLQTKSNRMGEFITKNQKVKVRNKSIEKEKDRQRGGLGGEDQDALEIRRKKFNRRNSSRLQNYLGLSRGCGRAGRTKTINLRRHSLLQRQL